MNPCAGRPAVVSVSISATRRRSPQRSASRRTRADRGPASARAPPYLVVVGRGGEQAAVALSRPPLDSFPALCCPRSRSRRVGSPVRRVSRRHRADGSRGLRPRSCGGLPHRLRLRVRGRVSLADRRVRCDRLKPRASDIPGGQHRRSVAPAWSNFAAGTGVKPRRRATGARGLDRRGYARGGAFGRHRSAGPGAVAAWRVGD